MSETNDSNIAVVDGDRLLFQVPATDSEALKTPLVGFFEKRHLRRCVLRDVCFMV